MGAALQRLTFATFGLLFCHSLFGAPVSTLSTTKLTIAVSDINGQPAADMVVYATPKVGLNNLPANTQQLVIDQKDKKFAPYVTVMQKGQPIQFSNKDDITHHIYSVSGSNRFDFKLQAGTTKQTQAMDASEEVAMGCNIHDWMSGYALVVDTPFYSKTNKEGVAILNIAPLGEYTVTVWHPQLDAPNNRVSTVTKATQLNHQLTIKLSHAMLPVPPQTGQDEFDFIEEYE